VLADAKNKSAEQYAKAGGIASEVRSFNTPDWAWS
jgi:hypothetical protein